MSEIFKFIDHMMILADYKNPEEHKHLAYHLIISLGKEMEWKIEDQHVKCRGICIASNVKHAAIAETGTIVFLFTELSRCAAGIKKKYLKGKNYEVLSDSLIDRMLEEYEKHGQDKQFLDSIMLQCCGIFSKEDGGYEERVKKILQYISELNTIEHSIVEELSQYVCLSKSRLSHLFKEQTGMTLHSYLAFEKLKKTYKYFCQGSSITDACILAGFDSSSHCAATCKRMFGISLREVYKTIKK